MYDVVNMGEKYAFMFTCYEQIMKDVGLRLGKIIYSFSITFYQKVLHEICFVIFYPLRNVTRTSNLEDDHKLLFYGVCRR